MQSNQVQTHKSQTSAAEATITNSKTLYSGQDLGDPVELPVDGRRQLISDRTA